MSCLPLPVLTWQDDEELDEDDEDDGADSGLAALMAKTGLA
jgi:hypothetical protein